jgi:hypothetical protein
MAVPRGHGGTARLGQAYPIKHFETRFKNI